MKKLPKVLIGLSLVSAMAFSAMAGVITAPVYPKDYKKYEPFTDPTTAGNNVIPGWGYIGADTNIKPNPDPEKPPIPDTELINVEVPTQFIWAAFSNAVPAGSIVSPQYMLKNNDENADLSVTLHSFEQVIGPGLDNLPAGSTLTLNLTGFDMAHANILSPANHNYEFPLMLKNAGVWLFGISGNYAGTYPANAAKPKYRMTLKFAVVNMSP